jgi:hypothetical protein
MFAVENQLGDVSNVYGHFTSWGDLTRSSPHESSSHDGQGAADNDNGLMGRMSEMPLTRVRRTRRISRCRPSTRYMNINMGGLERLTRLLLTSDIYNIGQPVKHATVLLISRVGVQCPCSTCCTYVLGAWNGMTVISVSARSTEPKSQCGDQRVSLRLMVARAFFVCRPSRSPCMVPHGPLHRL